ncbi:Uncharacterised protein [Vibrio cholerae]|nr:Uncharacterised protein [Vibrio cholerae]
MVASGTVRFGFSTIPEETAADSTPTKDHRQISTAVITAWPSLPADTFQFWL